jgi:pyridoxal phosphate enzyme (YggS family)
MAMILDNILAVRADIAEVCRKIGRDPGEITLVGVTKSAAVEAVKEAVTAGITDIGENRVRDARDKFIALEGFVPRPRRHMIGHLQSNKVKPAVELFDLVQSVDSPRLALELQKEARQQNKILDVLVQVNVSGEKQKFGTGPDGLFILIDLLAECEHLRCRGLMTIAPLTDDEIIVRRCFRELRELYEKARDNFSGRERVTLTYLSMGMSGDYRVALEEGANMLRIGSAIFRSAG